jgi:hypothetical protein
MAGRRCSASCEGFGKAFAFLLSIELLASLAGRSLNDSVASVGKALTLVPETDVHWPLCSPAPAVTSCYRVEDRGPAQGAQGVRAAASSTGRVKGKAKEKGQRRRVENRSPKGVHQSHNAKQGTFRSALHSRLLISDSVRRALLALLHLPCCRLLVDPTGVRRPRFPVIRRMKDDEGKEKRVAVGLRRRDENEAEGKRASERASSRAANSRIVQSGGWLAGDDGYFVCRRPHGDHQGGSTGKIRSTPASRRERMRYRATSTDKGRLSKWHTSQCSACDHNDCDPAGLRLICR